MENTNSTNKEKDLLLANKPRIVPNEQKGCYKWLQRINLQPNYFT